MLESWSIYQLFNNVEAGNLRKVDEHMSRMLSLASRVQTIQEHHSGAPSAPEVPLVASMVAKFKIDEFGVIIIIIIYSSIFISIYPYIYLYIHLHIYYLPIYTPIYIFIYLSTYLYLSTPMPTSIFD